MSVIFGCARNTKMLAILLLCLGWNTSCGRKKVATPLPTSEPKKEEAPRIPDDFYLGQWMGACSADHKRSFFNITEETLEVQVVEYGNSYCEVALKETIYEYDIEATSTSEGQSTLDVLSQSYQPKMTPLSQEEVQYLNKIGFAGQKSWKLGAAQPLEKKSVRDGTYWSVESDGDAIKVRECRGSDEQCGALRELRSATGSKAESPKSSSNDKDSDASKEKDEENEPEEEWQDNPGVGVDEDEDKEKDKEQQSVQSAESKKRTTS